MRCWPLILLVLLSSCTGDQRFGGAPPLPINRFASAYAGLLEASIPPGRDSLAVPASVDSLLAFYTVTRDQFNATVAWCNDDTARWNAVMDEVVRILEEEIRTSRAIRTGS
jgi:hypothetical protein